MSNYGLIIQNERTQRAFDEGYTSLNFAAGGVTYRHSGNIFAFEFHCPTRPVLFYRASAVNGYCAPHYVWDKGGGWYRAYTLGEAEVFAFSTHVSPNLDTYGMRVWSRSGKLVYQSGDETIRPIGVISVPHENAWHSGSGRKIAFALHGIARVINADFLGNRMTFRNTLIQSISGGVRPRLITTYDGPIIAESELRKAFFGHSMMELRDLNPNANIPMLIVDVHDIKYPGMRASTIY